MAQIISICSEKGGVGKTTSAVNIAGGLTRLGKKVLVIDLDQQCNASRALGYIKDNKLTLSFENLKMIKDIKNRFYSGLNGEGFINFGETSNRILRIYAKRILSECFGVGEHACPCTKLAALNQFVHYWINYGDHERTHAMTPVEIFTYRKGICADSTHLLIGFCSCIGIYNVAKASGVAFNSLEHCEKHAWVIGYCPGCKQYFEFDPTWGLCYQVGPEHLFISKTQRINDSIDKSINGEVNRYLEVYINGIKIPIIE